MDMKNKKIVIIAAVVLTVLLAVVLWVMAEQQPAQVETPTTLPSTDAATETVPAPTATDPVQPTDGTQAPTEPETTEPVPTEKPTQPVQPTQPPTRPVRDPVDEPPTEPAVPEGVHFPYAIPGTPLVIDAVNSYSGIFLEDGSDREADGIYAIILRNTASTCVEYTNITLIREDGKQLLFSASALDANATVVVMEAGAEPFRQAEYDACSANMAQIGWLEMSEGLIRVEEDDSGALLVTNISGADIPCVRLFYKFYMEDVNVYVGGITYTAKIDALAAGESRTVMPSHYAKGSSRIVMVKVYDTAEG